MKRNRSTEGDFNFYQFEQFLSVIEVPINIIICFWKALISYEEIAVRVEAIRSMLGSMGDGEISSSAYDTAWVALVEDIHGSGGPQFPSSLHWIVENQLPDGSWGDRCAFSAHDRLLNTLACVIALKSWNIFPDRCDKGIYIG